MFSRSSRNAATRAVVGMAAIGVIVVGALLVAYSLRDGDGDGVPRSSFSERIEQALAASPEPAAPAVVRTLTVEDVLEHLGDRDADAVVRLYDTVGVLPYDGTDGLDDGGAAPDEPTTDRGSQVRPDGTCPEGTWNVVPAHRSPSGRRCLTPAELQRFHEEASRSALEERGFRLPERNFAGDDAWTTRRRLPGLFSDVLGSDGFPFSQPPPADRTFGGFPFSQQPRDGGAVGGFPFSQPPPTEVPWSPFDDRRSEFATP